MRQIRLSTNRNISVAGGKNLTRGKSDGNYILLVSDNEASYIDLETGVLNDIPLGCSSPIVEFSFLLDGSFWFAHQSGILAQFSPSSDDLEVLGEQDEGLLGARWSPDGELLVMVSQVLTSHESLQLLTSDFDVISAHAAITEETGDDTLVNVGWGSRETQFMGSVGKNEREKEIRLVSKIYYVNFK